jgi:hypothetical protein
MDFGHRDESFQPSCGLKQEKNKVHPASHSPQVIRRRVDDGEQDKLKHRHPIKDERFLPQQPTPLACPNRAEEVG